MIQWQLSRFQELSVDDFHKIAMARQAVFIVEQHCAYLDMDDSDLGAWHLIAWDINSTPKEVVSYCRIIEPHTNQDYFIIGRVLSTKQYRGKGHARSLMEKAISTIEERQSGKDIVIGAQLYLRSFYESLGFCSVGGPYDEDGIEHIKMTRHSS